MTTREYVDSRRWLKMYTITWEIVHYDNNKFSTTEHSENITARNIIDAIGKATIELHKCRAENILGIKYNGKIKITEGVEL